MAQIKVDITRGFDVMRGKRVLVHCDTYEDACKVARAKGGRYVRYWGLRETK